MSNMLKKIPREVTLNVLIKPHLPTFPNLNVKSVILNILVILFKHVKAKDQLIGNLFPREVILKFSSAKTLLRKDIARTKVGVGLLTGLRN